jgi:hypothetical protein
MALRRLGCLSPHELMIGSLFPSPNASSPGVTFQCPLLSKMRVLDTTTLEFQEFPDLPDEPYAILSHRWRAEEVTFREYRKIRDTIQHRAGYKKIVDLCYLARRRGLHYAWVDTCCIDKRSSAELSEAINSMYRWYKESAECYVFLDDYDSDDPSSLARCEWFSRGWTLQELIAPEYCIFFTAAWTVIGHKHHWKLTKCPCNRRSTDEPQELLEWGPDLLSKLATITHIQVRILTGTRAVSSGASVAQRMSWASQRATTRIEDRVYSLLGIFDINMPLLYGEGLRAFRRLQEEIIRTTHDTSIFCFGSTNTLTLCSSTHSSYRMHQAPLLAESPAHFSTWKDVRPGRIASNEPYSVTNMGLRMVVSAYTRVRPAWQAHEQRIYAIPLECRREMHVTSNRWPSVPENVYLIVQQLSLAEAEAARMVRVDLQSTVEHPPRFTGVDGESWELTRPLLFYIMF